MATLFWTVKAVKQLRALQRADQLAVTNAVAQLADWPACRNVKALAGRAGYRLRVGRFRVLFGVDTAGAVVVVRIEEVKKRNERTY